MVCVYCNGKTQVINSRLQKRSNTIWRRRKCLQCQNVFSTKESADLAQALRMELTDGTLLPFDTYVLFISVFESLKHRDQPVSDAHQILNTVISDLLKLKQTIISRQDIINSTYKVLKRFDRISYIQYKAFHKL